jgi:hypothetical protein
VVPRRPVHAAAGAPPVQRSTDKRSADGPGNGGSTQKRGAIGNRQNLNVVGAAAPMRADCWLTSKSIASKWWPTPLPADQVLAQDRRPVPRWRLKHDRRKCPMGRSPIQQRRHQQFLSAPSPATPPVQTPTDASTPSVQSRQSVITSASNGALILIGVVLTGLCSALLMRAPGFGRRAGRRCDHWRADGHSRRSLLHRSKLHRPIALPETDRGDVPLPEIRVAARLDAGETTIEFTALRPMRRRSNTPGTA